MNDDSHPLSPDEPENTNTPPNSDILRSPVRPPTEPRPPVSAAPPSAAPAPQTPLSAPADPSPHDPVAALNALRAKMDSVVDEFATGKINRAQFHAVYKRYHEQRAIIEKLLQRNPESDAWQKVVGTKGATSFLRQQFEAQAMFFAVFRNKSNEALSLGGRQTADLTLLNTLIQKLWTLPNRPTPGLARKALPNGQWLLVATGDYAATLVAYSLEPSNAQARLVRDLHADFERANQAALSRGWIVVERMVFPQRALAEGNL